MVMTTPGLLLNATNHLLRGASMNHKSDVFIIVACTKSRSAYHGHMYALDPVCVDFVTFYIQQLLSTMVKFAIDLAGKFFALIYVWNKNQSSVVW